MKSISIALPEPSLIGEALSRVDYLDVFAIDLKSRPPVASLPPLFFRSFPAWFVALLHIREAMAGVIGLKTAHGIDVKAQLADFRGEPGQSVALFHVLGRSEEEILTGEDDRHLDFRLSFFVLPREEGSRIALATTVQFKGWLGRLYFLPVRPIHRLIVPVMLRRMAKKLENK